MNTSSYTLIVTFAQCSRDFNFLRTCYPIIIQYLVDKRVPLLYFVPTELSPDLYSWLFEMDIVKSSRTVKTVLENNGLLEPEHQGIKQRERKAASVLSDYLWPNGRIPYVFDSIMSE